MRLDGELSEWLKVHPWKGCVQQCTGGSNPSLSAKPGKFIISFNVTELFAIKNRSFWYLEY